MNIHLTSRKNGKYTKSIAKCSIFKNERIVYTLQDKHVSLWRGDSHSAVRYASNCNMLQVITFWTKPIQSKSVLHLNSLRTDLCSLNISWSDTKHSQMCCALPPLQIYSRSFTGVTDCSDLCIAGIFAHIYKAEMYCTFKCLCLPTNKRGCIDD